MTNLELQQLLSQLPPQMEVATFDLKRKVVKSITQVYAGNEIYISPNRKGQPDKIFLQCE